MYKTERAPVIDHTRVAGPSVAVAAMLGTTLIDIRLIADKIIVFTANNGDRFVMYHEQDCCETVTVKDVTGDLKSLLNSPLVMAEEVSNQSYTEGGTETWTFYKFATNDGYVTISWLGESNGYYSERVDFFKIDPAAK